MTGKENVMARKAKKSPTEIPQNMTLIEASDFWDEHSFLDYEGVKEVEFEVDIQSRKHIFTLEADLAHKVIAEAKLRGVSSETLLNLWVQEKVTNR